VDEEVELEWRLEAGSCQGIGRDHSHRLRRGGY
jgi:hypothetical protein